MDGQANPFLCQFTLENPASGEALHVGSVLNLTMDIPEQYGGCAIGTIRCRGHVVSLGQTQHHGKVSVVCEIDTLDCDPELWSALTGGSPQLG